MRKTGIHSFSGCLGSDCPCAPTGIELTDAVKPKRLMTHLPVNEDAQKGY